MFTKIIAATLLLVSTTNVSGSPVGGRIVNGTDANPGEIPYIVSLRLLNRHTCGGSLLNERWVLTAAHCVSTYSASFFSVQYGVTTITSGADAPNVVKVSKTIPHENYTPGNGYANDIALVQLESAVIFIDLIQATQLPPAFSQTPENSPAVLAGWGLSYTGGTVMSNLQRVDIIIYTDEECESIHKNTGPTNSSYHICAGIPEGGKGQCSGDSGGPLTVDGIQVGIVSWSVKPCTVKGYPGVFCKVSTYIDWIVKKMAEN